MFVPGDRSSVNFNYNTYRCAALAAIDRTTKGVIVCGLCYVGGDTSEGDVMKFRARSGAPKGVGVTR